MPCVGYARSDPTSACRAHDRTSSTHAGNRSESGVDSLDLLASIYPNTIARLGCIQHAIRTRLNLLPRAPGSSLHPVADLSSNPLFSLANRCLPRGPRYANPRYRVLIHGGETHRGWLDRKPLGSSPRPGWRWKVKEREITPLT